MWRPFSRVRILGLTVLALRTLSMHAQDGGPPKGEWRYYSGDNGAKKYSPLDQINKDNVAKLRVAWRRPHIDPELLAGYQGQPLRLSNNFRSTPIMVNGVLYASNAVGLAEAFDPGTGKTIWLQKPGPEGIRGGASNRGVAYWSDASGGRILTHRNQYLYALDPRTGEPFAGFGDGGKVDLNVGLGPLYPMYRWGSTPLVVRDVVVMGSSMADQDSASRMEGEPGDVRAYDVRTGKLRWTIHVVPREGEPGTESWDDESWSYTGAGNVWALMSADDELGYVYLPTTSVTNDMYGGHRRGNNLYSDCIIAVEATTGKRVWYFQTVHHDLFDYDNPAAPILADITLGARVSNGSRAPSSRASRGTPCEFLPFFAGGAGLLGACSQFSDTLLGGRKIKAVVQVTKQSFAYVLDRVTGKPVWPIEERPVPASTVPGEKASPTQPFPTKPPAFDRQGVTIDDLIDFTPELRAEAIEIIKKYVTGPVFTPPSVVGDGPTGKKGSIQLPGSVGGTDWTGAAFDPETGMLYVPSMTNPFVSNLIPGKGTETNLLYRASTRELLQGPRGLPLMKPPYGRITAIDLNRGEQAWMVPNGDGPRNHPLLKDLHLPPLGQAVRAAPLVTKTLLFVSEGDQINVRTPPNGGGRKFRAFDKATGKVIWETELEAGTTGTPITYLYKGRQFIVVAIGGLEHPAELIALSLPATDTTASGRAR